MRQKTTLLFSAGVGGVTSLPVIALLYLGEQWARLPFVPFDLFDWLARVLPGEVVTFGIDLIAGLVRSLNVGPTDVAAKLAEQLLALGLTCGSGLVLGLVIAWAVTRSARPAWQIGAATGLLAFVGMAAIELNLGLDAGSFWSFAWLLLVFDLGFLVLSRRATG